MYSCTQPKDIDVSCSFMGATWNIRTRRLWYIFDVDIITVLVEKNKYSVATGACYLTSQFLIDDSGT